MKIDKKLKRKMAEKRKNGGKKLRKNKEKTPNSEKNGWKIEKKKHRKNEQVKT